MSSALAALLTALSAALFFNDISLINWSLMFAAAVVFLLTLLCSKRSTSFFAKWFIVIFIITNLTTPGVLEVAPEGWIRPWIKFDYNSEVYPDLKHKTFEQVVHYDNVHSFTEAMEVMKKADLPVIFKGLMNNSEEMGWKILKRLDDDGVKMRVAKYKMEAPYDFMRGAPNVRNGEAVLASVAMAENSPYFAAFEPFLNAEEIKEITGEMLDDKYAFDTNFMSNFNQTVVTSGTHGAAVITSWSLQMMGKKSWFLWSPEESRKMHKQWWGRTPLPAYGSERDMFDRPTYKVVVEAGDVLAFPPYWMHGVTTHEGPNLMLNLRTPIGWVPFGGDWLCGLRVLVGMPMAVLIKMLPKLAVVRSNPLAIEGLRNLSKTDMNAAWYESPSTLRTGPPEQYL